MNTVFNPDTAVLKDKLKNQLKSVSVDSAEAALVKFTYHGKERVLRPERLEGNLLGGWVINEPGEAVNQGQWTGEKNTPYKKFATYKMLGVEIVPDQGQATAE